MASDRSLFPRLKRLFSTGTVISNIGGNELKVSDFEKVQAFGLVQTNSLVDRFYRINRSGLRASYNPTLNYQTLRLQLYSDYEAMDTDAFVASTLDLISHDCTGKGENGEVISIKSSNDKVQEVLYSLFYDTLNIEFNLPMWVRSMCKYGDLYLKLNIAERFGVYSVYPFSVYDIIRKEGDVMEDPSEVTFLVDPTALSGGTNFMYNKKKYYNYEIAHFRLIFDANYLPYGRSFLEPARKTWKQLTMMEDAFLLHRITRSADKRVFRINVGNIPPNEVDNYIQQVINQNKRTPYQDPTTGDYNLKFNIMNLMEDFYIPVRGENDPTGIENLPGLNYTGMDDVLYLRDKMFAALKVPKDRLNFTQDINGKSTLAGIGVNYSKTIEYVQKIVESELTKIARIHLYVQGFEDDISNFELRLHNPSIIYKQEQVSLMKEQMDLWQQMQDGGIYSSDYFMNNVMEMSEDQIASEREKVVEDRKRMFRLQQLQEEGNDPAVSGESYGTPHDLASLYGPTYSKPRKSENIPLSYKEQPGRPVENPSNMGTDDSAMGRDPLGKDGNMPHYYPEKPKNQGLGNGPLRLEEGHKVNIYESAEEDEGLLSEDNLMSDNNI